MNNKLLITLVLIVLAIFQEPIIINADKPFREHRYSGFRVLPEYGEDDILFIGNSITHMMNWNELFGNTNKVHNRGVSGAYTNEVLENLESLVSEDLSKIFLMIGTNDLGTEGEEFMPDSVARRIGLIISRMMEIAPQTEIFYESILPSTVGLRTQIKTETTNELVKNWIDSLNSDKVKYINLYSLLVDNDGNLKETCEPPHETAISYDGLHLTQKGYKIWADFIKDQVGLNHVIPDSALNLAGNMKGSNAMSSSYFGVFPIEKDDIVLIGDEMISTGEWQDLLGSNNIKNRGIGWGYPGLRIPSFTSIIDPIFSGNSELGVKKESPKAVALYLGVNEIIYEENPEDILTNYKNLVDSLESKLPQTSIFIITGLPFPESDKEFNKKLESLNGYLKELAQSGNKIFLIDAYREFVDEDKRKNEFFMDEESVYLNGEGYKRMANILSINLNLN